MSSRPLIIPILLAVAAYSQQSSPPDDTPNPEDANHGVARISLINGDVSVRRGDSGDVVSANVNAPLLGGDLFQTGAASRAELEFDDSSRVRLSASSELQLGDLRAGFVQLQLARGVLTFYLPRDPQTRLEIGTRSASIRPLRRGDYRVEVLDDGTTRITMRGGDADIYTPQGSQRVSDGQTMVIRGAGNDSEYQIIAAVRIDEWDQFNERRNRELERSTSYQHVSRDITGAEDLDGYGQWVQDQEYGQVWAPNVATDWAPYQSGRWVWGDYYGWTWVSYDPWGWAPYHYGRWFHGNAGWCWSPGAVYARNWYRPALVSFFGFGGGSGFGAGFGFGNLGWVALAPHETFHPWWGRGAQGRGINVFNNVNIYNTYRNARAFNGVSSVTAQQFQGAQFGRVSHPTPGQLASAGAIRGQIPLAPGSANFRYNDRRTAANPRPSSEQQHFVSRGGFSVPVRQSAPQSFGVPRSSASDERGASWQRFGSSPGTTNRGANPVPRSAGSTGYSRQSTPAGAAPWGQFGLTGREASASGGNAFRAQGRPVEISPPIVQQRSNSRPGSGSYSPAYRQTAPASGRQATPNVDGGRQSVGQQPTVQGSRTGPGSGRSASPSAESSRAPNNGGRHR